MKKNYLAPNTMIVELAIESALLDASVNTLGGEAKSDAVGMSRQSAGWDDEE